MVLGLTSQVVQVVVGRGVGEEQDQLKSGAPDSLLSAVNRAEEEEVNAARSHGGLLEECRVTDSRSRQEIIPYLGGEARVELIGSPSHIGSWTSCHLTRECQVAPFLNR